MPVFDEEEIPAEVKRMFPQARTGEITPKEFCLKLQEMGITGVRTTLYVARAFNLPLEAAKTIAIENEYGSTESWAEAWTEALEKLDDPK